MMKNNWDLSYKNGYNHNLYPNEELIRFLNTFIKKQVDIGQFKNIYNNTTNPPPPPTSNISTLNIRALDFGCGIGRQTLFLSEFDIESHGIDISKQAIDKAKKLSEQLNIKAIFEIYDGKNIKFRDNFFDFSISLGVLNCIPIANLPNILREIKRVTKKYCFFTLIGDISHKIKYNIDNKNFNPIEFYFNDENIFEIFNEFQIININKNTKESLINRDIYTTYSITLQKN
ncbi:class I SAM-dependent methyltransferase [Helicobacter ibis]|uniref:Class I SAM-dependent methyltransferase n=1 Tax=Helicobacter ibis TaxID=2962633 RepID=A0ABT4VEX0_9HELI|nr:class I SAM-dependent methyltransferase [Helicobacter ibis]MDA3969147.1 class I SAM-dependent methyltransferase [Helicobacter ibis]